MSDKDFSRQLKVAGMNPEKQQRIEQASVAVFGAGGLGVTAISYLAAAGIGTLTLIDDDIIEASNLHRQIIYGIDDIGQPKALKAKQFAEARSFDCEVNALCYRPDKAELLSIFKTHDVILDCTDDIEAGYQYNQFGIFTNTPVIFGNAAGIAGQIFTMNPNDAEFACLNCLWPPSDAPELTCDGIGVLGPVPGAVGCMQALEALKLIADLDKPLQNQLLNMDFSAYRFHKLGIQKNQSCNHSPTESDILMNDITQANAMKEINGQEFIGQEAIKQAKANNWPIIDIRNPEEVQALRYDFVDNEVPMEQLLAFPQDYLEDEQNYLLVCVTGARSQGLAKKLREEFDYQVFSLKL